MATLHPFRALRPTPERAKSVASPPYDVVSTEEARALADGNPRSFLHVVRPEIDLPEGTDLYDDAVYEKGAENLRAFAASDDSLTEDAPAVYVYRLVMDGRSQIGLFGCVSVEDYDDETILKHELTRPAKEDDRTRHILTQEAHAEPVMLTYRDRDEIDRLTEEAMQADPLYDFEADDGVRHTIWRAQTTDALAEAFEEIEHLYVADGHHRCKASSRAAHELREDEGPDAGAEYEFFPAVLFPMGQMHIMAYNRLIYDLLMPKEELLNTLKDEFGLEAGVDPVPDEPGRVCIYTGSDWHGLALPASASGDVADQLDVARLGEHVLEPMLGVTDPRRDENIGFVGGIRGTSELEERVDSGEAELAISMYPTSIEELVEVSDAGQLMPPKSTWFEPKLRSGLLVHLFD
jgi:uncharacterized protein (DUF1015 family)